VDAPSTRTQAPTAGAPFGGMDSRRQRDVRPKPPPKYTMFRALGWIFIVGSIIHAGLVMIGLLAMSEHAAGRMQVPIFLIFLFLVLYVIVAIGIAQGIWAVLEIVANTRAVLPPPVDAFD